jgi:hypothetical protein
VVAPVDQLYPAKDPASRRVDVPAQKDKLPLILAVVVFKTVTVKLQVTGRFTPSLAVYVTVVVPSGKLAPGT